MFAVGVCNLPATGGSIFVVFAGLFLLVAGVIVTRWVRQSSGRMSVVVAPLLLLGGLVLAPAVTDSCASTVTTLPGTTDAPTTTGAPETVFSNDDVLHAYAMSGDSGTWTGDTTDATAEEGEPYYPDAAYSTVWFKWVATTDGQLVVDTCDTSFDIVIGVYTIDDINDPWVVEPAPGYTNIVFDDWRGYFRCASPADQIDPGATTVDVTSGTTYYIQLSGFEVVDFGSATLNWDFNESNDNVADAYDLGTADSGTWTGDTTDATMETNEPWFDWDGSDSGNNSVWFKFVAWGNGQLVVDSCGTSFDSVLSAYSIVDIADPWNDYSWITDDDASATCQDANNPAQVRVGVTQGQTYYIQLDGFYGPATGDGEGTVYEYFGAAQVNWSFNPLTNDDIADAYDMSGSNSGRWNNDTTSATYEDGEPNPFRDDVVNSTVWFRWVASESGTLTVDSCNTPFDSVLSAYTIDTFSDPGPLTYLAGDDASVACDGNNPALLEVAVETGTTYYFQLDGFSGTDYGPAQVNWSFEITRP